MESRNLVARGSVPVLPLPSRSDLLGHRAGGRGKLAKGGKKKEGKNGRIEELLECLKKCNKRLRL